MSKPQTKAGRAVAEMLAKHYQQGTFGRGNEDRSWQLANEDVAAVEMDMRRQVVEQIRNQLVSYYRRSDSDPESHAGVLEVLDAMASAKDSDAFCIECGGTGHEMSNCPSAEAYHVHECSCGTPVMEESVGIWQQKRIRELMAQGVSSYDEELLARALQSTILTSPGKYTGPGMGAYREYWENLTDYQKQHVLGDARALIAECVRLDFAAQVARDE